MNPAMQTNLLPADHTLHEIEQFFVAKGGLVYGEAINQIEHALQCGTLAEQAGAPASLIVAALLHDIGHMLHRDAATALARGDDDMHEALGARYLSRRFGAAVSEPVRLHVQAKRYLCTRDVHYWAALSALSQRTLELQGGPMSEAEAAAFEQQPSWQEAVQLRRWDDIGKQPEMATPPLSHFLSLAAQCLVQKGPGACP